MLIQITDLQQTGTTKKESFLNKRFQVQSRSGLNITEKKIIDQLSQVQQPEKVLFIDNRTGVSAIIFNKLSQHTEIFIHTLDIHHANTVKKNLSINNNSSITVCCEPYIQKTGQINQVFLQVSHDGLVTNWFQIFCSRYIRLCRTTGSALYQ